jgi:hypothetical protein
MTVLIRAAALALALAAAPAAQATPLCESLKAIIAGMDASPMFQNLARAENNRPVGTIIPDGWVRCTIGQYEETTGRYTCYGAGGRPQATQQPISPKSAASSPDASASPAPSVASTTMRSIS